ncbi:16S rRNA (guanine(966)-N(2))-methyltransferase RsmD [Microbacterium azadirachtae]|uniref:Ribosomal RNA small subunit methyltransferase D n=1 Tax=Microbacterium azadirachtae TaxID=582680 RepID=A0A0F0KAA1_9MICO|nr:16S rRNA (guanine(966)-N(2))-methyltransferase RsmD [Microbacterium azadirachtae]KJL17314.1 Ribosomal RNA small subunit methyltransferase D [Microbacterium azadirachtae]UXW87384.1 16S rRNA (guanine(966)-N(2))-methyltransferase RsmD [Microbacterium azadirachtae]SDL20251.1 16S rRNA (guanine966-N2)-methyltransferase [Microbacterium azadirachtae]SEF50597.1 16S rRNA (guanine966-N2)-methyltransferase [Microbacterium azadirachtae]SEF50685.1 16S rRNA (guanine966-N2)-methyltransferase [Microbacteriu
MTRIIAGAAGGTRLDVPGQGTRPTSDRVRESLFGALESMDAIGNARVLDLYAGSGALGLEALSRGARSAVLVERGRPAAAVIRRNVAAVRKALATSTDSDAGAREPTVVESAVHAYLTRATGPFDLVFTDPPYDLSDADMTADLVAVAPLLSSDAVVVIERARRATPPDLGAAGLSLIRERSYGDTALWWAEPSTR